VSFGSVEDEMPGKKERRKEKGNEAQGPGPLHSSFSKRKERIEVSNVKKENGAKHRGEGGVTRWAWGAPTICSN